jgi:signal transduction histidine kinase
VGRWDEDALCRIAENLLENAIKFTPADGHIMVRVREDDDKAVLDVEDTGIGISDDDLDYIFEAFRQVEQGPKREYEGSGLGLSIVKKLIDALDGRIDVQSAPNQGSCFTVSLPKTPSEASGDLSAADPSPANGELA